MARIERIETAEALEALIERSHTRPLWIFKHSLTCGISAAAWRQYASFVEGRPEGDEGVYAMVEIQRARPVSSLVAERTGVAHKSPQALLVAGGEVVWSASHFSITREALEEAAGSESTLVSSQG